MCGGDSKSRSRKRPRLPFPCIRFLAGFLLAWRERTKYAEEGDYVFPSVNLRGKKPLSASIMVQKYLRPAAIRAGVIPANWKGRLERDGLFRSEVIGRQKYFQLNREYPLFDEVRKIVAKTIGAAQLIGQAVKRIEGIDEAYLYGSFASNQQDAASDIDVLVIGSPREEDLAQAVRALVRKLGREINYTVLTPKEFGSRRARKDAFLENLWHNKRIPLVGSNEETKVAHR